MTEATIADDDRGVVRILAFAGREFDRVHDLLVRDDEPGEQEVAAAPDTADAEQSRGVAGRVLGVVGTVARTAGRAVTGSVHPRHDEWDTAGVDDRIDWWVDRFGTAGAALAAVPGLGGKLGKLTSAGDVVGASAQVLVVNAVAREMDVTDLATRVTTAARIVLGRDLDPQAVAQALDDPEAQPEADAAGDGPEERSGPLARVGRSAALVWRVANRVRRLRSDLGKRPQGGFLSRAVSNLPAVGAVGSFVSERKGISRAAAQARDAFGD